VWATVRVGVTAKPQECKVDGSQPWTGVGLNEQITRRRFSYEKYGFRVSNLKKKRPNIVAHACMLGTSPIFHYKRSTPRNVLRGTSYERHAM